MRFVARRLLGMVGVLFAVSVIVFAIFFATPGVDPARQLAGRDPTPQTMATISRQFGLNRPLPIQYVQLMKKLFVTRDLVSYSDQGEAVIPEIKAAAPVTLSLVLGAAVIWVALAICIGAAAFLMRDTVIDPLLMLLALIGISIPGFWLGEVVNLVTQARFHHTVFFSWVPPLHYIPLTSSPVGWFESLTFPWITLSVLYIGLYARVLRADMLEVQHADYVRTARAKGLSERRILRRHVLRTSMITFISLFGLDFGALVGGAAILTEVVFGLHGVGYLTYEALSNLDLPVILATVIYGAFFIVLANTIVDITYAWLDPRVRLE